jgi:hypothetical protein
VLGIDVGFSATRPSTGLCVLAPGDPDPVRCAHVWASEALAVIPGLVRGRAIAAIGVDGPLRPDLTLTTKARECERRLFRAPFHRHCKPGSTAAPMGQLLHAEATRLARPLRVAYPRARIVEAFPTAFLRTLLAEDAIGRVPRGRKTQVYWEHAVADGALTRVVAALYGAASAPIAAALPRLTQRDVRAAAICALAARAAALGRETRVGDAEDGWIALAPRRFLADWARRAL